MFSAISKATGTSNVSHISNHSKMVHSEQPLVPTLLQPPTDESTNSIYHDNRSQRQPGPRQCGRHSSTTLPELADNPRYLDATVVPGTQKEHGAHSPAFPTSGRDIQGPVVVEVLVSLEPAHILEYLTKVGRGTDKGLTSYSPKNNGGNKPQDAQFPKG